MLHCFIYASHCLSKEETKNLINDHWGINYKTAKEFQRIHQKKRIIPSHTYTGKVHYCSFSFLLFFFPFLFFLFLSFPFTIFVGAENKINLKHDWPLSSHNFPSLFLCLFFPLNARLTILLTLFQLIKYSIFLHSKFTSKSLFSGMYTKQVKNRDTCQKVKFRN